MEKEALLKRIIIDPNVCHGKPCVRGLRYPVGAILEYLAGGDSVSDIVGEFPDLEEKDILACLAYASLAVNSKTVVVPFAA